MSSDVFQCTLKADAMTGGSPLTYTTQVIPHVDRQFVVELLASKQVSFGTLMPSWTRRFGHILLGLAPFLYLALVYKLMQKLYNPSDSVGKHHRLMAGPRKKRVTFADVAGVDTAKIELKEIVDFLKDRSRFYAIGARLPKGILLSGPPGTG